MLLDGKTQVPRTRTLCTADVRYGISVNTSTNPYLQVDAFPKAYQASSIAPVCQSAGGEPDQIPSTQRCLVGRYESGERTCLLPQTRTRPASSLPPCSQFYVVKTWSRACSCHSSYYAVVANREGAAPLAPGAAGRVGNSR